MATNVLGDGVNDHICTEVEWVLEVGGEEGVVNNELSLLFLANLGDSSNIADLEGGIRRSFGPDNLGIGLHGLADKGEIAKVDEIDSDTLSLVQNASHVTLSSTVNIIHTENVVSAAQKVHDCQESTATTVQSVGILGILKSGKVSLKSESGRVSASCIVKADWLAWIGLSKCG